MSTSYEVDVSMDTAPPNAVQIRSNGVRGEPRERRYNGGNRRAINVGLIIIALTLVGSLIVLLVCKYKSITGMEDISLPFMRNIRLGMNEVVHEHQHIVHEQENVILEKNWLLPERREVVSELTEDVDETVEVDYGKSLESAHSNPHYSLLVDKIREYKLEVIPGPFLACVQKGWFINCADKQNDIKGVLDWEIRAIVHELSERREEFDEQNEVETIIAYKKFITVNGSHYGNEKEFVKKYFNFKTTKKLIDEHNSNPDKLYTMAYSWASEFSDSELGIALSTNGWSRPMYMYENGRFIDTSMYSGSKNVDDGDIVHKDWRNTNAIGPVVDQGSCGSCWAVAVAGLVDAYRAITTGQRLQHSVQQILDCTSQRYNCVRGGNQEKALVYASTTGLCIEPAYPYLGRKTACREETCGEKFKVDNIKRLNARMIQEHLRNHGPVMIIIRLSRAFMHYSSGIFDGSCDSTLMHSVLIVGYGENTKRKTKYWIVKNSWGDRWGDGGYFKLHNLPLSPAGTPLFCGVDTYAFGLATH